MEWRWVLIEAEVVVWMRERRSVGAAVRVYRPGERANVCIGPKRFQSRSVRSDTGMCKGCTFFFHSSLNLKHRPYQNQRNLCGYIGFSFFFFLTNIYGSSLKINNLRRYRFQPFYFYRGVINSFFDDMIFLGVIKITFDDHFEVKLVYSL